MLRGLTDKEIKIKKDALDHIWKSDIYTVKKNVSKKIDKSKRKMIKISRIKNRR